jgi:putative oxidoreductase
VTADSKEIPMAAKVVIGVRILLGLVFFVLGLNGFFFFIKFPPMSGPPADFAGAMIATGYFFPFVHGTEAVAGALLLGGRFVPLALVVIAPVVLNVLAFHAFLAPHALAFPLIIAGLEIFLAWSYRSTFRPVLRANASPDVVSASPELQGAKAKAV